LAATWRGRSRQLGQCACVAAASHQKQDQGHD
jgi:hypothetical protein